MVDVFPLLHCVNTHLNAPDQQTEKSFCFYRGVPTYWWSVNQMHLIISTWLILTFLIPKDAVRMDLVCHTLLLHFVCFLSNKWHTEKCHVLLFKWGWFWSNFSRSLVPDTKREGLNMNIKALTCGIINQSLTLPGNYIETSSRKSQTVR